jgi:arsenate reductase
MSLNVRIYHNPHCSKSRETLALLEARGLVPELVAYLSTPPSAEVLAALASKLGIAPHGLLRTKEAAYVRLGLTAQSSSAELFAAIAQEPALLERPIVEVGDRAVFGRPPEAVLALLEAP